MALTISISLFIGSSETPAVKADLKVSLPSLAPLVGQLNQALDPVSYEIHTLGGSGCATSKVVRARYAIPTPVDLGGSALPDATVLVAPIPPIPGVTNTTNLTMLVTKIGLGAFPAQVQAVLAPNGSADPSRVAFGFNACNTKTPLIFRTQVSSAPTRLSVDAFPTGAGSDLTILGAAFNKVGTAVVDPTQVAAKFAPVPSKLQAIIDILGNSTYKAHITTPTPSELGLAFLNEAGAKKTTALVGLANLPPTTDLTFSAAGVTYATSAPIHDTKVDVTSLTAGEDTTHVNAHLVDLPTAASFAKDTATNAKFTTTGKIGEATIRFAKFTPGADLPAPPSDPIQYLSASLTDNATVADLHLLGVGSSAVGWGDVMSVDLKHTPGPFDVSISTPDANVIGKLRDLPETVFLSYEKDKQAAVYRGSDKIASVIFDLTSTKFIMGRATKAHLEATDVPTGLGTVMNAGNKTFDITMTGGKVGQVELLLTNGPENEIPSGDGLLFFDPIPPGESVSSTVQPYEVFLRASEVKSASLGWGAPISVDIEHTEALFTIDAQIARNSVVDNLPVVQQLTIDGVMTNLPETAHVKYFPPVGGVSSDDGVLGFAPGGPGLPGGIDDESTASRLTYDSLSVLGELTLDVTSSTPLFNDAKELQVTLTDLPTHIVVNLDDVSKEMTAVITGPPLGRLDARIGSDLDSCIPCVSADEDGIHLIDRLDDGEPYLAEVHIGGITGAEVGWGNPLHIDIQSAGDDFGIRTFTQTQEAGSPIQTQRIEADIDDLPSSVDLTYNRDAKEVHYTANEAIGTIIAHAHNFPDPIIGSSHNIDATLTNLPPKVDLVLGSTETSGDEFLVDKGFSLDTGPFAIGRVEFLVTDADEDKRDLLDGRNGVLIDDFDSEFETIYAQANNLRHVDFRKQSAGDPKEFNTEDIHVHTIFEQGNRTPEPLMFLRRTRDNSKLDNISFMKAVYERPPADIDIRIHRDIRGTTGKTHPGSSTKTEVTYSSPSEGKGLEFSTNAGAGLALLRATIEDMPKTLVACISPHHNECASANNFEKTIDESSYKITPGGLKSGEPTHVEVFHCAGSVNNDGRCGGESTVASLFIEKELAAHVETDDTCEPDCQRISVDTANGLVHGTVVNQETPDDWDDLKIVLPEGFKAQNWGVNVECSILTPPSCTGHSMNSPEEGSRITCPAGIEFRSRIVFDIFPIDISEEICPKAGISGVNPSPITQGANDQVMVVHGENFSSNAWVDFGEGITTKSVVLPDGEYDRLIVVVDVAGDAPDGFRGFAVSNPGGDLDHSFSAEILEVTCPGGCDP